MKTIMLNFISIIALITFVSCKNDDDNVGLICEVSDPIEELSWLKEKTTEADKYVYFTQANYKNETVFIEENCNPLVNSVFVVYDCAGGTIGDKNLIIDELSSISILWKHSESECDF